MKYIYIWKEYLDSGNIAEKIEFAMFVMNSFANFAEYRKTKV